MHVYIIINMQLQQEILTQYLLPQSQDLIMGVSGLQQVPTIVYYGYIAIANYNNYTVIVF